MPKTEITGYDVHFEKFGSGPCPILLLPGGTGSILTDLWSIKDSLNPSKYTVIAMDPIGYGKSRPPCRDYSLGTAMYKLDADIGVKLMKSLGYESFVWMGWSDGGRAGLVAAISYPSIIDKLIVWGSAPEVTRRQQLALEAARDLKFWDETRRDSFVQEYGSLEEAQKIWGRHVDFYKTIGNICKDSLGKIRCPVLIMHGERDPIELEQGQYMADKISDGDFHVLKGVGHAMHIEKKDEFLRLVNRFLED